MTTILALLATTVPTVPDSGSTGFLLGLALLATGVAARLVKNRKK